MNVLVYSLGQALASLREQYRRLLPMALGIVWGMASVMVLLAVASGFERSQQSSLAAYGDRFLLLRLNRAELDRAGGSEERRLLMDQLDIERLRIGAPAIRYLSPVNTAHRARVTGRSGAGSRVSILGTLPEVTKLRNLQLAEGRFFDEIDEERHARVIVLGPRTREQLFGDGPALGELIRVAGFARSVVPDRPQAFAAADAGRRGSVPAPRGSSSGSASSRDDESIPAELFEVIGVLADVEVREESYVSVARAAFIPFSTSCAVFDREYNTIYISPRSIEDQDLAMRQFREVMGARYGFDANDENAVLVYFDAMGRARAIAAVFRAIRIFLSSVGILILAIGGIGVMNVVLVSLAARRFEIGLRKALGATPLAISLQFFAETVLTCIASGALGFLLGAAGVELLGRVPLPQGFTRPVLDARSAMLSFGLLSAVAVVAGFYPARRAAGLEPVVALQSR